METVYDWVSVFVFAGLIVLFVHRATSAKDDEPDESVVPYLIGGVGCAVGNYLGNEVSPALAVLVRSSAPEAGGRARAIQGADRAVGVIAT